MKPTEWKKICDRVTEAMRLYTRPCATPLSTSDDASVRLVGSGTYAMVRRCRILLTCEHVARITPMEYRFFGSDSVFRYPVPFTKEPDPLDAAFARIPDVAWNAVPHRAASVPYERLR
jgi:hypothetical protein